MTLRTQRPASPPGPLRTAAGRLEDLTSVVYHSRKSQPKRCAFPLLGHKIDGPAVELNHAERGGQTDSGSVLLGGEIEVENAVAELGRNARARVADLQPAVAAVAA